MASTNPNRTGIPTGGSVAISCVPSNQAYGNVNSSSAYASKGMQFMPDGFDFVLSGAKAFASPIGAGSSMRFVLATVNPANGALSAVQILGSVASVGTGNQSYTLKLSSPITLVNGTHYCILINDSANASDTYGMPIGVAGVDCQPGSPRYIRSARVAKQTPANGDTQLIDNSDLTFMIQLIGGLK